MNIFVSKRVYFNNNVFMTWPLNLPRIFQVFDAGKVNAVGSTESLPNSPKADLVVVVILVERVQMFRVVVDGDALTSAGCCSHGRTSQFTF